MYAEQQNQFWISILLFPCNLILPFFSSTGFFSTTNNLLTASANSIKSADFCACLETISKASTMSWLSCQWNAGIHRLWRPRQQNLKTNNTDFANIVMDLTLKHLKKFAWILFSAPKHVNSPTSMESSDDQKNPTEFSCSNTCLHTQRTIQNNCECCQLRVSCEIMWRLYCSA